MTKQKNWRNLATKGVGKETIRNSQDYYATPPIATLSLLEVEKFNKRILEPCCGGGHISEVLKDSGYKVFSYDLFDHGYGVTGKDFLKRKKPFRGDIITNPPYQKPIPFVQKSLDLVEKRSKVALLLKLDFLVGISREELFKESPPKRIWVFSSRIRCGKGGDLSRVRGGAINYAWFIWEKGFKGSPQLDWIRLGGSS